MLAPMQKVLKKVDLKMKIIQQFLNHNKNHPLNTFKVNPKQIIIQKLKVQESLQIQKDKKECLSICINLRIRLILSFKMLVT